VFAVAAELLLAVLGRFEHPAIPNKDALAVIQSNRLYVIRCYFHVSAIACFSCVLVVSLVLNVS